MFLVSGLLALLLVAGCGTSDPQSTAVDNNERTVGNPAVYARIDSLTDCVKLQTEFDIAADNTDRIQNQGGDSTIPQSYMSAAHNRMRKIGCYG